jgi:simple sugar transport system ATP-binding protein
MTSSAPVLVEMTGVEKRFGTTRALRGVDLSLSAGQCLGLVGRNGAGKSTIVSILSGLLDPDAGQVRLGGAPAPRVGDVARWREWIATVFQHSMIVPDLTVAENVFLGAAAPIVNWRERRARTRDIMREWGFDIAADALCRDLPVEQLQIVEIARALARGARCVLLDEPTAALERDAVRRLFERVRQLTAGGVAVLYISHHLEEVFEICQQVVVLRDGERVLAAQISELSRDDLVAAMVGGVRVKAAARPPAATPGSAGADEGGRASSSSATPVLTVTGLTSGSPAGRLSGVSLTVRPGEVVGVTGLLSAGVATLGRVVAGAEPRDGGEVWLRGRPVPSGRRAAAQRLGIGYIPEDRRAEGFVAHLGVAENATMTITGRLSDRLGFLSPASRAAAAAPLTSRLSLVASGPAQPVGELSGGNQQKVTVARTLAHDPALIVAITPTRGVDVASKALLLDSLADVARASGGAGQDAAGSARQGAAGSARQGAAGAGVLLCSDELSDLVICDRVIVLVRGEVFAEFTEPPFDRDELIIATEGLSNTEDGPAHMADGSAHIAEGSAQEAAE